MQAAREHAGRTELLAHRALQDRQAQDWAMAQVLARLHRKVLLLGPAIRPDLLLRSGVALLDAAAQKAVDLLAAAAAQKAEDLLAVAAAQKAEDLLAAAGVVAPQAGSQNPVVAHMVDLHLLEEMWRHSHRKGLQILAGAHLCLLAATLVGPLAAHGPASPCLYLDKTAGSLLQLHAAEADVLGQPDSRDLAVQLQPWLERLADSLQGAAAALEARSVRPLKAVMP